MLLAGHRHIALTTCYLLRISQSSHNMHIVDSIKPLRRSFATDVPAINKREGGAGFFQRLTSFFVGAGLTAVVSQFYILDEVRQGNRLMLLKQEEVELRLAKLEKNHK